MENGATITHLYKLTLIIGEKHIRRLKAVFEKTCALTQKNVKSYVFWGF